jgi:predicted metal-dependent HD superfamily phosphohydrolase
LTTDSDAAVLNDADLWILGAPGARYRRYVRDVRLEYGHLNESAWKKGRAAVLEDFVSRDRLYSTDQFQRDFGVVAKRNMSRELAELV